MAVKRAVFLDKDGTLVKNVPFNVDPERIVLSDGALEALQRLRQAGYAFAVVSNQPGVALGCYPFEALAAVEARLRALLASGGVELTGCYWCPHAPPSTDTRYERCRCRKPSPELLLRAARTHGIDLSRSWMIGDILDDVEAGHRAGCRSVLLDTGSETVWRRSAWRIPDHIVTSFADAASAILSRDEVRGARLIEA